jgi:monoamine oxidase
LSTELDIVIVGGGAAGAGAARALSGSGHSVRLLEASATLGGRAWTQVLRGFSLDLGAGWLHSADRSACVGIAQALGMEIDRTPAAWGVQFRDLGFTAPEQSAARRAYGDWVRALAEVAGARDRAADALPPVGEWNPYVRTIAGFISGAELERLSATDYLVYDEHSTDANWRVREGYGSLVARSFPADVALSLATPVRTLELGSDRVGVITAAGTLRARAVILTVSTTVLANGPIELPAAMAPWREAAQRLPLGHTEKLFLEITGEGPFAPDTQVLGDPRAPRTGSYYLRPFGLPVIECFLSAAGATVLEQGSPAGFAFAIDQLCGLFGEGVRRLLRPLAASDWRGTVHIGGAYSYALPGQASARRELARPFAGRVFFAGEATSIGDFSTVHGAHDSGVRAAQEALSALSGTKSTANAPS